MDIRMTLRHRILVVLSLIVALAAQVARAQDDEELYAPAGADDSKGELPANGYEWILAAPSAAGYGYGYDSLLADLAIWSASPRVTVSNIGRSVQNRTLWQLSITSPSNMIVPRHVIAIHARTHPNEPQSSHVVNAMIDHLLSDDPAMKRLLEQAVFNIIPMYNPDGVELETGRTNARGVDLEREWDKDPAQIEAAQLKARYGAMMTSPTPIRVMLNIHSAYLCQRYFVYHVASATSQQFALDQQRFITAVRRYFEEGINPWQFYQSWKDGRPTHFPESWFWENYRESVMALTYEDMNCATAGAYDTTAYAILRGIADYLEIDLTSDAREEVATNTLRLLRDVVPNPFSGATTVRYALPSQMHVALRIFDALGTEVARLVDERQEPGWHEVRWRTPDLPEGVYYFTLQAGPTTNTLPVIRMR